MKSGFLDKLIERLDQVDPAEVQHLVGRLVRERGFFESVFEALQEGVIILDPLGMITFINHSASKIFGIDSHKSIGENIASTLRGINWEKLTQSKHTVSHDLEIFYPEQRFLNFYLSPIRGDIKGSEALLGYALLVRDITNSRKQAEENVQTEKLNALTLLAAGVAHEIGNPLNSLDIHLQLLERKIKKLSQKNKESLGEHLQTAQREIRRLDTILKQFLQAIRPRLPERKPHQIQKLLHNTLKFIEPELSERKVKVVLKLTDSPPLLELDGDQIQQAFYNLLKNAYQALPAKGGEIKIQSTVREDTFQMIVQDNGSGISPELMSSIFEPFLSTKKTGTGLGLLIVRRIIRDHGGQIDIDSQQGKGTKVSLSLPLHEKKMRLLENKASSVIEIQPIDK